MNKRNILLVISWGLSILIAVWCTANWNRPSQETAAGFATEQLVNPVSASIPGEETLALPLQAEIDSLRAELAVMEQERQDMGKKYLALSLEKWADNDGRVPATEADARKLWEEGVTSLTEGGLDSIEENLRTYGRFVSLGKVGIRFLGSIINDPQRSSEEREAARDMLQLESSPASYAALLGYLPLRVPEDNYPYGSLEVHLERLPTYEVRSGFPRLLNQIRHDLASKGGENPTAVLGHLAFTHGDGGARQMLRDRRLLKQPNVWPMLQIARKDGTAEARNFIQFIAQGHENEKQRQQAQQLLDNW
ncbi:MAG: hypothetical protein L3K26_06075 [Candidatus Hydrogenedentes bacterium]|nr:hypothetical protein [Candidatus Hydrogenedentota bacterium]